MGSRLRSIDDALRLPRIRGLSPVGKTLVALGTYGVWTALTWLLEGRIQTLLRPDAVADRVVYTGLANVVFGTIIALVLVREFAAAGFVSRADLGFQSASRAVLGAAIGATLGFAVFVLQNPASTDPVVVLNVFAQVLPVSIAELVVCWVVVGGSLEAMLSDRGVNGAIATAVALVVSSLLFGAYHVAHSPPFNTFGMVGLLSVVGVGTGLVYFVGRSFYGALAFHNAMALYGVVSSLAAADRIVAYYRPLVPLVVTALVALVVVIGMERRFVRDRGRDASGIR